MWNTHANHLFACFFNTLPYHFRQPLLMKHTFSNSPEEIFSSCVSVLQELDFSIIESDLDTGKIIADKSINLLTYGHRVEIQIDQDSQLTIDSRSKGIQLIDWGTNNSIKADILTNLSRLLK